MPLPAFLTGGIKALGMWILKMILGSFADGILRKDKEKAERESDALRTQLETQQSGKNLEVEIMKAQDKVEEDYDAKVKASTDDPLGFKAFNETN